MKSLTLVISALTLALVGSMAASTSQTYAQSADVTVTIKTDFKPPSGSVVRVFGQRSSGQCAEVSAAEDGSSKSFAVASRTGCALATGDNLSFWLFTGEGAGELLTTADGQSVKWEAGKALDVTLARVPCPDPCRPPDIAGVPDTGLGSSGSDAVSQGDDDGISLLTTTAIAILVAIAATGLVLMARRRRAA